MKETATNRLTNHGRQGSTGGNITYTQAGVLCFVGQVSGKNPCLRIAENRYRKPYGDSTINKLSDMEQPVGNRIRHGLTVQHGSQRNEVLFFAYAQSTLHFKSVLYICKSSIISQIIIQTPCQTSD